jgi:hypothetical protein
MLLSGLEIVSPIFHPAGIVSLSVVSSGSFLEDVSGFYQGLL